MGKVLRSYTKIWDHEKKIYSINDKPLPAPINLRELGYFLLTFGVVSLAAKVVPFIDRIPSGILYLVIPYMMTQFLIKKKLDGKRPIPFFRDWIMFQFRKGIPLERFKKVLFPNNKDIIRINGYASCRR